MELPLFGESDHAPQAVRLAPKLSRQHTGLPTNGAKNRELITARPDLCVAVHQAIRGSTRTRDCALQALQSGIPT
jgi:hypothetical protein